MEQNQFEGLEAIEQEEVKLNLKPELKEYEKLLLAEQERQLVEKARALLSYGCFTQKEETVLDFTIYSRLETKKYKGKYDLYQYIETGELVWICPLIEAGDDDDKEKVKKPYAYDCVIIDKMDEETYQEVVKAANHNLRSLASVCYKGGVIGYIVLLVFTLVVFINNIIGYFDAGNSFFNAIAGSINSTGVFFGFDVLIALVLVVVSIKFKKYKNQ